MNMHPPPPPPINALATALPLNDLCTSFRAFFNIYTGGAKNPQAPMLSPHPPLKGFGPPSSVPFCLKMSENHAEIARNQV